QQLAVIVEKQVHTSSEEVAKSMKPEVQKEWQDLAKPMAEFAKLKPLAPPTAMVLTDVGPEASPTYLLRKGDWRRKGHEVAPGFLSALDKRNPEIARPAVEVKTTGRRSALADWLTQHDNPLTSRV